LLAIVAAAVAVKVAAMAPGATNTEVGTESKGLLLAIAVSEPPAGAVCVSVTVQVLRALWPRLDGLHETAETRTGAARLIVTLRELPPKDADRVAVWLLATVVAAVALKVAVLAPGATDTDAGTESKGLLLVSAPSEPPAGAACVRVTVQMLTAPWLRVPGLQAIPETRTGATKPTFVAFEIPPAEPVTVAF
jgi:hypothetical protein